MVLIAVLGTRYYIVRIRSELDIIRRCIYRSPRWSSGYPRMLLALVLDFESHRDAILNSNELKNAKDQLLRAPSVGRRISMRVDEGRKG